MAVFKDLYGNLWDLLQMNAQQANSLNSKCISQIVIQNLKGLV